MAVGDWYGIVRILDGGGRGLKDLLTLFCPFFENVSRFSSLSLLFFLVIENEAVHIVVNENGGCEGVGRGGGYRRVKGMIKGLSYHVTSTVCDPPAPPERTTTNRV